MTDKDIIKALEHCTKDYRTCNTCPQVDNGISRECACVYEMLKEAFSLIKNQQAEIERLKTEKDNLIKNYTECQKDFLKDFVGKLKAVYDGFDERHEMIFYHNLIKAIDSVVVEMVGDDND